MQKIRVAAMKKIYADLHLDAHLKDPDRTKHMLNKASSLGYSLIATTFPPNCTEEQIKQMRNISKEAKMDLASRVDLKPKTPNELLYNLRRIRRKFEIVAVVCEQKNVARQAAKDRRVDILDFPSTDFHKRYFDRAQAELASNSLASFEIDLKPLLTLEGSTRIRLLSSLRKEAATARKFHIPIVLSSGISNELYMRKPMELAALASLFDLDEASAVQAVSTNPMAIVKRNRQKLSPKFVAPGIRIVRRGRDC